MRNTISCFFVRWTRWIVANVSTSLLPSFVLQTSSWWRVDTKTKIMPSPCSNTDFFHFLLSSLDPAPIPLSLHLLPTWLSLRFPSTGGGGFKCRGRQSDAGVSSSDPDVLIPRCLVTLTGSDSLAK